MVRSRSRSPRRGVVEKRRSRSRERDRERDRERRRHHRSKSRSPRRRSRSKSPRRRRSPGYKRRSTSRDNDVVITGTSQVSPSHIPSKANKSSKAAKTKPSISVPEAAMEGKSEEEIEMMKLMGFGDFNTTKGKHVPGADISATNVIQKRKYRQYMNRRGGFNRPLDFIA